MTISVAPLSSRLFAVLTVCMLFLGAIANAQPPCPPGATTVTVVRQMSYNGVCCNVEITYCYVYSGGTLQVILLDAVVSDASCWGLAPGSALPFSANYFAAYVRDLVLRSVYPGTLPTCPTMATVTIAFFTSTCAEMKQRVFDPDGPSGPILPVLQLYLAWCSNVECVRECQVCVDITNLDPCTQEPRLYFECTGNYNQNCPNNLPQPNNCENLCGS